MRRAGNKSVKRLPETEQSSPSKNFGSPIIIGNLGTSNRPHKEAPQKSGKTLEEPVTRADILKISDRTEKPDCVVAVEKIP